MQHMDPMQHLGHVDGSSADGGKEPVTEGYNYGGTTYYDSYFTPSTQAGEGENNGGASADSFAAVTSMAVGGNSGVVGGEKPKDDYDFFCTDSDREDDILACLVDPVKFWGIFLTKNLLLYFFWVFV